MKYIIGKNLLGHPIPVVFDEEIPHGLIGAGLQHVGIKIVSASYVDRVSRGLWRWRWEIVQKGNVTAQYQPHPDDLRILRDFLQLGLSGAQLSAIDAMDRQRIGDRENPT